MGRQAAVKQRINDYRKSESRAWRGRGGKGHRGSQRGDCKEEAGEESL